MADYRPYASPSLEVAKPLKINAISAIGIINIIATRSDIFTQCSANNGGLR